MRLITAIYNPRERELSSVNAINTQRQWAVFSFSRRCQSSSSSEPTIHNRTPKIHKCKLVYRPDHELRSQSPTFQP